MALCERCQAMNLKNCYFKSTIDIVLRKTDTAAAKISTGDQELNYLKALGEITQAAIEGHRLFADFYGCPNNDYNPPYAGKQYLDSK